MYSLLKETKTCQVCKKSFPNGNALGGHMKSHSRKLSTKASAGSIIPSLRACNDLGADFKPHETVLMRSVQTSEVVGGRTPDLNKEGEQQTTAGKRKIVIDLEEETSTESPYCLTVEECASCLLQMKADKWSENGQNPKPIDSSVSARKRKDTVEYIEIDSEEDHEDGDDEYVVEDEDSEDGDVKFLTADSDEDDGDYADERKGKKKSKYMCDICGKVLSSYQALGGHRTSHRNKRLKISGKNDGPVVRRRHYQCQICDRVFESGQALGGHKKSHYMFLQPTNLTTFRQDP